jgi:hypothetical protein
MSASQRKKPLMRHEGFRKLTNRTFYYALKLPSMLFGWPFWLVEQKIWRLEDEWDNEGWDR